MPVQALMCRYATWLQERRTKPTNVRDHMEVLASFWTRARAAQRSPARGSTGIVRQRLFAAPVLEVAVLNLPELDGVRST